MTEEIEVKESSSRKLRSKQISDEKEQIRNRVWEDDENGEVEVYAADPTPEIDDDTPKRVAAYARVSTLSTEQTSSIEYQTRYYTEKIENEPNWTFSGIYSDEGKSGTSMKHRAEFMRLMQDCYNGNIDLIICASVSRFARNVSECLEQVETLKTHDPQHPVGVYFETENIYTLDSNSDQAFDMHAMLADWESATKSRRMLLSYDQRIMMKHYPVSDLLGYRHTKDGKLVIDEDEAKTVRYIFLARLLGQSFTEIANVLIDKERTTLTGSTDWTGGKVADITKNERRWGDLEARKTIVISYKKKKSVKNTYEKDGTIHHHRNGAMVHNHHEGIVTPQIAKVTHMVDVNSDGISDLYVIPDGVLKGFVSSTPGGTGLDADIYMEACKSAYTDGEIDAIKQCMDVRGDRTSAVEIPRGSLFINSSTPTLTMNRRRLQFNKKLLERFGDYVMVEVLYHPILQMLAIRTCNSDNPNAVCLRNEVGEVKTDIAAQGLCGAIFERMDWINSFSFKFKGVYRERNGFEIMFFYLDDPLVVPDKASKGKRGYIPYRNAELNNEEDNIVRPDFGIPIHMRYKRDQLLTSISGEDIGKQGRFVKNTNLGDIPSREEIVKELEELLMSM
ncbi:MAG: recombinase family protein [Butyrivibrio sp.]|nr:recombinase family protein [Butyrivibrio sp.]